MPVKANADASPSLTLQRDDDFISRYANNVQLESSGWDLKLVFGLLDQRDATKPIVEQHTSINLAWPEVKVLIYYMQVHMALQEKTNGKIKVPEGGVPVEPPQVTPPQFDNPDGQRTFEIMRKMRQEFVAKLNEP